MESNGTSDEHNTCSHSTVSTPLETEYRISQHSDRCFSSPTFDVMTCRDYSLWYYQLQSPYKCKRCTVHNPCYRCLSNLYGVAQKEGIWCPPPNNLRVPISAYPFSMTFPLSLIYTVPRSGGAVLCTHIKPLRSLFSDQCPLPDIDNNYPKGVRPSRYSWCHHGWFPIQNKRTGKQDWIVIQNNNVYCNKQLILDPQRAVRLKTCLAHCPEGCQYFPAIKKMMCRTERNNGTPVWRHSGPKFKVRYLY